MALLAYNIVKAELFKGNIDFENDTLMVLLVSTSTTADTEQDVDTIDGFTTLDEVGDAAYSRQTLANQTVTRDDVANEVKLDGDDATFSTSVSGDVVTGAVLYKKLGAGGDGDDTQNIPIAYFDGTGFGSTPNGANFKIIWHDDGIYAVMD